VQISRRELFAAAIGSRVALAQSPMPLLIIDGQNNHDWKSTSPVLKRLLEESGLSKWMC